MDFSRMCNKNNRKQEPCDDKNKNKHDRAVDLCILITG